MSYANRPSFFRQHSRPGSLVCLAFALCASGPLQAATATLTVGNSGTQTFVTQFDISIPLVGANTYLGTAFGAATADHIIAADAGPRTGVKLTIAAGGTLGNGLWTPGLVTKSSTIPAPPTLGSTATGSTVLTGTGTFVGTIFVELVGQATSTFSATLHESLNAPGGGQASYRGVTNDPFPFGTGGEFPITGSGLVKFGLTLPPSLPALPDVADGSWSVNFTSAVSDTATFDDQVFWGSHPQTLYSVTYGAGPGGAFAHFVPGSPQGFAVSFGASASQIEASLIQIVNGGNAMDLQVFSGTVDLSGHASATLGNSSEFNASLAGVPEPATAALLLLALPLLSWRVQRRR